MDNGLIIDLETSGMDPNKDEIIEIGIVSFKIENNHPPTIVEIYGSLNQPKYPIKDEITNLTKIKNSDLEGQYIDWDKVLYLFDKSVLAIAHNASFDVGFLSKIEILQNCNIHWACSMNHIDWAGHGFKTKKLNYLAADHGFVNPFSHRAVFDCITTYNVIQHYIKELIESSYKDQYEIIAENSPYESKNELKKNGYFWDIKNRVWKKHIFDDKLDVERDFLKKFIYKNGISHHKEIYIKPISLAS